MFRHIGKIVFVVIVLAMFPNSAQADESVSASSACNHAGFPGSYGEGYYRVLQLNLRVDSLTIPNGMRVTIYSQPSFQGQSSTLDSTSNGACLSKDLGFSAASMIVTRTGRFSMLVASDTQLPWLPCNDNSPEDCPKMSDKDKMRKAVDLNLLLRLGMLQRIESLKEPNATDPTFAKPVRGLIINGDLTAYGHGDQLAKFRSIWLEFPTPVYLGLGNHDYANNVDDCFMPTNNCAIQMVELIYDRMSDMPRLSFDMEKSDSLTHASFKGSMAYSFDMGRVHFVQLQNYPIYTRGFSGYWTSRGKKYSVEITSSLDWLEHDLAAARNRGQAIILNYHDTNGNWKSRFNPTNALSMLLYTEQAKRFSAMLKTYAVSAIFAGHYHKWIGPRKPQVGDGLDYGDIPIYYSGSASQGTFLEVTFRGDTMSVAPKRVSIGPNVFPPKIKVEDVSATTSITLKQEIPPTPFP